MAERGVQEYENELELLVQAYPLGPGPFAFTRFGSGHINDTVLISPQPLHGEAACFVAQRINQGVFPDPEAVISNIVRTTNHIRMKVRDQGVTDENRRVLHLLQQTGNASSFRTLEGAVWRVYHHIPDTCSFNEAETPALAEEAARAFGRFQRHMMDLSGPPLKETIARFHHGPTRYEKFGRALEGSSPERKQEAAAAIRFAVARRQVLSVLVDQEESGEVPLRITHNDTKLNNVLFDVKSKKALCVVDLDTVMPGLVHYDFGDLVRTATCPAAEDETNHSLIRVDALLYEAVVRGYASEAKEFLTVPERESLAFAGVMMTFLIGLRFLTDYLDGDRYFRIHRPRHNLDRAEAQFALVAELEKNLSWMQACVRESFEGTRT
jgi:hypothetical protein